MRVRFHSLRGRSATRKGSARHSAVKVKAIRQAPHRNLSADYFQSMMFTSRTKRSFFIITVFLFGGSTLFVIYEGHLAEEMESFFPNPFDSGIRSLREGKKRG
ncbi:hypothetical protein CEXT_302921 [Caerostris extrusa]|uniref:Uncharacterized protein n=1 Tax=Caerostris extrusa TaxID=172846 RepID=A0AAV4V3Z6_CAEEX|nr:hypothetical protein CEXT_302921 [Caerostris extrusa]